MLERSNHVVHRLDLGTTEDGEAASGGDMEHPAADTTVEAQPILIVSRAHEPISKEGSCIMLAN